VGDDGTNYEREVEQLVEAAKANRWGSRDALMILLAYRHGLRAAEVCDLRWEQVDFKNHNLHVRRVKGGLESTHPLTGREMRELRKLQRDCNGSPCLFTSERGAPMAATAFSTIVKRAGASAGLGIKAHAHMLRHACGFRLANDGRDTRSIQVYLGHANIANTARYTALRRTGSRDSSATSRHRSAPSPPRLRPGRLLSARSPSSWCRPPQTESDHPQPRPASWARVNAFCVGFMDPITKEKNCPACGQDFKPGPAASIHA
jgi:integrase-like protein